MIYKDSEGQEWEECPKDTWPGHKVIQPVVKKPKWSVYSDTSGIRIVFDYEKDLVINEAIKAFIEAGLEYIYESNDQTERFYKIREKLVEAVRAIEEANA